MYDNCLNQILSGNAQQMVGVVDIIIIYSMGPCSSKTSGITSRLLYFQPVTLNWFLPSAYKQGQISPIFKNKQEYLCKEIHQVVQVPCRGRRLPKWEFLA